MGAPVVNSPSAPEATESTETEMPPNLRMRMVDGRRKLIVVTFSLERLAKLTCAELEVARLAEGGLSNRGIATARGTSTHTVARQMAGVLKKLRIGSRLGLTTVPELRR